MNWSPQRGAVVALLAVVALAAGAGAFSGADLGGGPGVVDVECWQSDRQESVETDNEQ